MDLTCVVGGAARAAKGWRGTSPGRAPPSTRSRGRARGDSHPGDHRLQGQGAELWDAIANGINSL